MYRCISDQLPLLQRDEPCILIQPRVERLQLRIESPRFFNTAARIHDLLKFRVELKHVAQVFGTGKPESPERFQWHQQPR